MKYYSCLVWNRLCRWNELSRWACWASPWQAYQLSVISIINVGRPFVIIALPSTRIPWLTPFSVAIVLPLPLPLPEPSPYLLYLSSSQRVATRDHESVISCTTAPRRLLVVVFFFRRYRLGIAIAWGCKNRTYFDAFCFVSYRILWKDDRLTSHLRAHLPSSSSVIIVVTLIM